MYGILQKYCRMPMSLLKVASEKHAQKSASNRKQLGTCQEDNIDGTALITEQSIVILDIHLYSTSAKLYL